MNPSFLRKLRKYDLDELLCWVSACQIPRVNKDRLALIEYMLAVLIGQYRYRTGQNKKVSAKIVKRFHFQAYRDFWEPRNLKQDDSKLQTFFPASFLFIRGEAFPWQYARTAHDRYSSHSKWMIQELGFDISDAISISKAIMQSMIKKSLTPKAPRVPMSTQEEFYDPKGLKIPARNIVEFWKSKITFFQEALYSLVPGISSARIHHYLSRLVVDPSKTDYEIDDPLEFNILNARPLVRMQEKILIVVPSILWRTLSKTFHYDFLHDKAYKGTYIRQKGEAAERRLNECLAKIFPKEELFPRVRYYHRSGWPDVDLVATSDQTVIFVECTAKWIRQAAKIGDLRIIVEDLKMSIAKCFNQLDRAISAYRKGKLLKSIPQARVIVPIIVVDEYIAGLDFLLQFCDFIPKNHPYIINIYDLDIITDLVKKGDFVDFVRKRIKLSRRNRIFCSDEIDYFVLHQLHGFEKFASKLEERNSTLHYIGHLENIDPDYYMRHFLEFCDDNTISEFLGSMPRDILTGWS